MAPIDEELKIRFAPLQTGMENADIAGAFLNLALLVQTMTPSSREQQLCHTKLEEAQMWAEAAIRNHPVLISSLYCGKSAQPKK